jgi:hypothetical protein
MSPDEVRPDRPEVGILVRRLRHLLRDVNHATVGVRVAHPPESERAGNRLAFDGADEDDELVHLRPRGVDQVSVARVIREKLAKDETTLAAVLLTSDNTVHILLSEADNSRAREE